MNKIFLLLACFLATSFSDPLIRSVQLYSRYVTILPSTFHSFELDFSCASSQKNDLIVAVNQPNFEDTIGDVMVYISDGPASGPFSPFPNPNDNSTYRWTTLSGLNILPQIIIPSASSKYFITASCPNEENCGYELSTMLVPSNSKEHKDESQLKPIKRISNKIAKVTTVPPEQQALFYGNQYVVNSTVNWNSWAQFELPLCKSAMSSAFQSSQVCLSSTVIAQGPGFLFYQQFSEMSTPNPNVPKWETRDATANPYDDLSGKSDLPINRFLSLPSTIKDLPPIIYHSVVGRGGQGVKSPFPNPFSVVYQFVPCSV